MKPISREILSLTNTIRALLSAHGVRGHARHENRDQYRFEGRPDEALKMKGIAGVRIEKGSLLLAEKLVSDRAWNVRGFYFTFRRAN